MRGQFHWDLINGFNMNKDILFLTNRTDEDHTRSYLKENLNFHNREIICSSSLSDCSEYKIILIDQFLNDANSVNHVQKIRESNEDSLIFLLASRDYTATEEEIINTYKISIFSLPISEVELFNRIIA